VINLKTAKCTGHYGARDTSGTRRQGDRVGVADCGMLAQGLRVSSGSLAMLAAIRWGLFTDEQLTGVFRLNLAQ